MQPNIPKPMVRAQVNLSKHNLKNMSTQRILFALSSKERDMFFPHGIQRDDLTADVHISTDQELTTNNWFNLLNQFRPSIIITCWSTPGFDEAIINSPWFRPEYICHLGGSVRSIIPVELIDRGVLVSNWGTLAAVSVAEHAVLLVLACARNLTLWRHITEKQEEMYTERFSVLRTRSLQGKRVGIHGFGNVAREVIRLLQPFDARLSAYSCSIALESIEQHGIHAAANLETLFSCSDIVIECEALTDKTRGSVTAELLARLPKDSIFVNVARGALVDESALAQLAESGQLRVATDVTAQEPLPTDSPLWRAPTMLHSPHIAGPTHDSYERCGQFAMENIHRFLNHNPLQAMVGKEIYMRST